MLTHHIKTNSHQVLVADALQRTRTPHVQACLIDILRKKAPCTIDLRRSTTGNIMFRLRMDSQGTPRTFATIKPLASFAAVEIHWIEQIAPSMWPPGITDFIMSRLLLPWPPSWRDQLDLYDSI